PHTTSPQTVARTSPTSAGGRWSRASDRETALGGEDDPAAHPEIAGLRMDPDPRGAADLVALADMQVGAEPPEPPREHPDRARHRPGPGVLGDADAPEKDADVEGRALEPPHHREGRGGVPVEQLAGHLGMRPQ